MIGQLLQNITKQVQRCVVAIFNIPRFIIVAVRELRTLVITSKNKLQRLYPTNMELGVYHLRRGETRDAILRFWLIDKFFKSTDQRHLYLLAISYWLDGKLDKALSVLARSNYPDKIALKNYLSTDPKLIQEIPLAIWQEYRILTIVSEDEIFRNYLSAPFTSDIFNSLNGLPKTCSVLELGSTGFIGMMLERKLGRNYQLLAVEEIPQYLEMASELNVNDFKIYDEFTNSSIIEFLESSDELFDLIISYNTLAFTPSLKTYFDLIHSLLSYKSYFALLLPAAAKTTLNSNRTNFCYNKEEVHQWLVASNFKVINEQVHIVKKTNKSYLSIITSKNSTPKIDREFDAQNLLP